MRASVANKKKRLTVKMKKKTFITLKVGRLQLKSWLGQMFFYTSELLFKFKCTVCYIKGACHATFDLVFFTILKHRQICNANCVFFI